MIRTVVMIALMLACASSAGNDIKVAVNLKTLSDMGSGTTRFVEMGYKVSLNVNFTATLDLKLAYYDADGYEIETVILRGVVVNPKDTALVRGKTTFINLPKVANAGVTVLRAY
jgi:hypothetical protein